MYSNLSRFRSRIGLWSLLLTLAALIGNAHAVTLTVDTTSGDRNLFACTTAANDCSFPGAIRRLSATVDTTIVFAVTSTLATDVRISNNVTIEAAGASLPSISVSTDVGETRVTFRNARWQNLSFGALYIGPRQIVTIEDSQFLFNRTGFRGGAILSEGELTIARTRFEGNYAPDGAGAIHSTNATRALNVTDSVFIGNGVLNPTSPSPVRGQFGAIKTESATYIRNSLFYDNDARYGAAIQAGAYLEVYNSTFWRNKTSEATEGGALLLGGRTRIVNSTIVENSGSSSGGLYVYPASDTRLVNTLIADNQGASPEISGRVYSIGNNLIRNRTGAQIDGIVASNVYDLAPRLGVLGNHGGATMTLPLLPGSPAMNAGSNCVLVPGGCQGQPSDALTTDQRGTGFPRQRGERVDIGAFEVGSVIVTNDQNAGAGSLRQAISDAAGDHVSFSSYFNQARTITLSSPLVVNKAISIIGPGETLLTLDGNNSTRHFNVDALGVLNVSGMRFIRGNPGTNADGGAILINQGTLNADDIRIEDSTGNAGGCIYNNGTVELARARLSGCRANFSAGLFNAAGRTATIRDSRIENNIATGPGGGISNTTGATLVLTQVSVTGNQATIGAGLNSYGTATLTNTTFSGNTAANGGGMYLGGLGTTTLTHATVTANTAQLNGGIAAEFDAVVNLQGSLIAGNARTVDQAPDAGGNFTSFGHNLIGNTFATVFRPNSPSLVGNLLNVPARLGTLADNGGLTLTHAPLHDSPIIDAAGPGSAFDGRGLQRPIDFTHVANAGGGNGSDIGAYELQVATPTNVVAAPVATGLSVSFDGGTRGGATISGYDVTCGNRSASGTASPIVVTGLAIGVQVSCTVTARSGALIGIPSAPSASVAPATVPGAPVIGTPVAGDARVDVAFTAPASNGGSPITGYTATCGSRSQSGTASPIRVTVLGNGVAVTCTVVATNIVGTGAASAASVPVTPVALLGFSSGAPAAGRVREAYLHQFIATGAPAPSYALDGGSFPPGLSLDAASGTLSGTPTTVGAYSARIRATAAGASPATQDVTITIAANVPAAPTIGSATAGDGQVSVSFTPPVDDGGSPIQFYNVFCTSLVGAGSSSPIVVSGVPNGVPQTCSVTAINAIGLSAPSAMANTVVPQASTTLTLTGSTTSAIAGSPVTYTAALAPASATGTVSFDPGPSADACTAVALVNGSASCTTRFRATGSFTIRASYSGDAAHTAVSGQLATAQTVVAPTITIAPALSGGAVGSSYGPVQLTALGGLAPHAFAITQGSLPAGLTLSAAGILSGTPTTPGSRSFTVTATDANQFRGTRDYTLSIAGVPGAPTGVVATRGNSQVSVAFVAPTDTGGSPITGYTATCGSRTQSGSGSPLVVTGLTNGVAVTCTVVASNAVGNSVASAPSASVTPATVPGAPTGVVGTRGNTQISVAFVAPADTGGNAITGYTATCGSRTQSGATSPLVVTGLTNGVAVTCTVIASNAIGNSVASTPSASVTPATVPGAPTGVVATRGNAQVSVAFVAPTETGGSAITGYTATCGSRSQSGAASPLVVTGLTNGVAVTCTVVASNAVGNSVASAPSASVTPATVPGAPTGVVATRGNAQVSVAFVAPTETGGSAITGYTATCGSRSQSGAASPIVVTGLTNGTPVTCTVIASNAVGNSVASALSASVTPATVPGAPTDVVATRGNAQVSVAFVAPTDTGGSAITGYTASCGSQSQSGAASPINVTGLSNGVAVTCSVVAINAIGSSVASASSASVTPATVPGAPTGVVATRGNAQVSVAFVAPAETGGSAITGYTATCGSRAQSGSASPIVVTGLANGTPVTCTVVASNAVGSSAASTPSASVTPATVPGAPTGVVGTRGNAQVSVAFVAPTDTGGSAITGYTASCGSQSQPGTASPITVTGLTNGVAVTCTVIASNAIGNSAASTPSASVTPATVPGAPTGVVGTRGNAQVSVAFVVPTDTGGSAITGYTATCGSQSQSSTASPINVTGLSNGVAVTCTVIASNAIGNSAASAPSASVTPATVPGVPTGVVGTRGNAQVSVAFVAPTENGGSTITGYTATCGSQSQPGAASPITVTGLANGVAVTCTVIASNAIGNSTASAPSASVTPATVPGTPTGVTAISGNGSATIAFAAPGFDGGASVSGYTARCLPGTAAVSGAASPLTVTGLVNGTVYTCRVTASNAMGEGPESAPVTVVPGAQPIADVIVSASNGTGFVTGGVPTVYTIRVRNSGPSGVANVRVRSVLDADFTAASWTCSGEGGGLCAASGSGTTLDQRVDLPVGGSVTFLLSATVAALPETPVSIVVSAEVPAPFNDPDLQSNVATDGPDLRGLFRNGFE